MALVSIIWAIIYAFKLNLEDKNDETNEKNDLIIKNWDDTQSDYIVSPNLITDPIEMMEDVFNSYPEEIHTKY